MSEPIVQIQHLNKSYGDTTAVKDLNLEIERGEIFGLLGPNGAGKSTTILSMLGLTDIDSGNVKVNGFHSQRRPIRVKTVTGYLPDQVGFYEDMTGMENLMLTARLNRISDQQALEDAENLLQLVYLQYAKHDKVRTFSRGMKQRLGLADILMKQPEIIIMDEPTLGIDPKGVQELLTLIKQLREEKQLTVILSSHHLQQVQSICDRVGLFMNGSLFAVGTVEELSEKLFANEDVSFDIVFENALSPADKEDLKQLTEGKVQFLTESHITILSSCEHDFIQWLNDRPLPLRQMVKQGYELQDIYERYFTEGGETT
ncbi:ABC transporter ATP-binding protein [Salibacterium halotolerans]|uniref:ABC-2 type transport system ATP-binding protein n=1 Tax=Salibacterium halotolerans TaxID=1884432 RepID=A0A1I5TVR3_9BACI|nr:ABC transporter ATP-binding protein [Salibacterium halotolerans]SFP86406.1 ABC-2 type transport system ATP-binding protein [Salibacterium halotolerans]